MQSTFIVCNSFSFIATLTHSDGLIEMVAIKVMKETANPEAKDDFKRETEIMTYFRHPNILTLLGVCADGNNLLNCILL